MSMGVSEVSKGKVLMIISTAGHERRLQAVLTVMSEDVHQREEVDLAPVLAGDGVQVPVRVDHSVSHGPLFLQGPPACAWNTRSQSDRRLPVTTYRDSRGV